MDTTFLDKKDNFKLYINQAKEDRKKFWKPMLLLAGLSIITVLLINVISSLILGDSFLAPVTVQIISFVFSLYSAKYLLNLVDNDEVSALGTLKSLGAKQIFFAFVAYVLVLLITSIGFTLLIVPGIILSYMFLVTILINADKLTGPIATLKESKRLTSGYKMKLFTVSLSVGLHYIAIPILLLLGSIVSGLLGLPGIISILLVTAAVVFFVYAQFALATLLPRMYRDLQKIKGAEAKNADAEVIEIQEVLEGDQTDSE